MSEHTGQVHTEAKGFAQEHPPAAKCQQAETTYRPEASKELTPVSGSAATARSPGTDPRTLEPRELREIGQPHPALAWLASLLGEVNNKDRVSSPVRLRQKYLQVPLTGLLSG